MHACSGIICVPLSRREMPAACCVLPVLRNERQCGGAVPQGQQRKGVLCLTNNPHIWAPWPLRGPNNANGRRRNAQRERQRADTATGLYCICMSTYRIYTMAWANSIQTRPDCIRSIFRVLGAVLGLRMNSRSLLYPLLLVRQSPKAKLCVRFTTIERQ